MSDPFDFERCLSDDDRQAAIDLITDEKNRALLMFSLDVACLSKRELVASIDASGDYGALGATTAQITLYAEMLHALARVVAHGARTVALVMQEKDCVDKGGNDGS